MVDVPALCDSAQRDRSLSALMLPMPPRHNQMERRMTAIAFLIFGCTIIMFEAGLRS
jgi:hypothetical protein